jgi:hypothetical protein
MLEARAVHVPFCPTHLCPAVLRQISRDAILCQTWKTAVMAIRIVHPTAFYNGSSGDGIFLRTSLWSGGMAAGHIDVCASFFQLR